MHPPAIEIVVPRIRAGSPECPDQVIQLNLSGGSNRIPGRAQELEVFNLPKLPRVMSSGTIAH